MTEKRFFNGLPFPIEIIRMTVTWSRKAFFLVFIKDWIKCVPWFLLLLGKPVPISCKGKTECWYMAEKGYISYELPVCIGSELSQTLVLDPKRAYLLVFRKESIVFLWSLLLLGKPIVFPLEVVVFLWEVEARGVGKNAMSFKITVSLSPRFFNGWSSNTCQFWVFLTLTLLIKSQTNTKAKNFKLLVKLAP